MPQDERLGIAFLQAFNEHVQGEELCWRACVCGHAVLVKTAFIAHADAVAVVVAAVGTNDFFGSAAVYRAVARNIIVVADVFEAAVADMVGTACLKAQVLAVGRRRTVDDDKCYCSHGKLFFLVKKLLLSFYFRSFFILVVKELRS